MENERIIEKIRKVLELSKNNPSEEEARAASLQAQKLLAKYHLEIGDIESEEANVEDIGEVKTYVGMGNKWKYCLAGVVSKNFRCRHYYSGKDTIVFYGHATDAEVAREVFNFLFNEGNRKAKAKQREAKKIYGITNGVFNAYIMGYLKGVQEALEEQCTALVLVVPKEVNEKYEEISTGFKKMKNSGINARTYDDMMNYCHGAKNEGIQHGKDVAGKKKLSVG